MRGALLGVDLGGRSIRSFRFAIKDRLEGDEFVSIAEREGYFLLGRGQGDIVQEVLDVADTVRCF